ncbi:MAG: hypothetical protein ACRCZ0_09720 [Cetobacterium sp.]
MIEKLIIKKSIRAPVIQDPCDERCSSYIRLNALNSWDDDFISIPCNNSVCNKITYLSTDPRLISVSHNGDKLALDTIPRNGKVQFGAVAPCICNEKNPTEIDGYKKVYNNYSDINRGDIIYYYASDLANPFIPQLFTCNKKILSKGTKPLVTKDHYIDPMNSYKPHYCREPIYSQNCLNWIKDSQFHREDLMSKQLWNRNQSNFEVDITT